MLKRSILVMAVAMSTAGLAGCGNPAGLFPVSGKVTYRGEPAAGAVVYFHRQGPTAASPHPTPSAIAEYDGSFYLTCDGLGDGCPPGEYAVLIEWKGKPDPAAAQPKPDRAKGKGKTKTKEFTVNKQMARQGVDRLKGRYFDIAKPLLHAEVAPRTNTLPPFELED
jgi:hypothetical protein